jgi:hypothetical protein
VLTSLGEGAELLTCLEGADAPLVREQLEELAPADVEFEFGIGGQQSYWWLIAAE